MKTAIQSAMISGLVLGLAACGDFDSSTHLRADGVVELRNDLGLGVEATSRHDDGVEIVQQSLKEGELALDEEPSEALDGVVEQALPDELPDGSLLVGSWSGDVVGGQFSSLVLMSDQRFHAIKSMQCLIAPCEAAESDGTYTLQSIDGRLFIEISEQAGQKALRYEVAAEGSILRLRSFVSGASWYAMKRADVAWCSTSKDCYVQNLPLGVRADEYVCEQNACMLKNGDTDSAGAVMP